MFRGAPPLPSPKGGSLTGYRSPQDHATDTRTGSIAKIKSCSIRSLFLISLPSQIWRWFVQTHVQRLESGNMNYEYDQQLDRRAEFAPYRGAF